MKSVFFKQGNNTIVGGDFNTCLEPKMGKNCGRQETSSVYTKSLIDVMEQNDLIDVWRLFIPETKRFAWRETNQNGLNQSRLYF